MNEMNQTTITKLNDDQRQLVIDLLVTEKLPVDDLPPVLQDFFVVLEHGKVIGAIGLERYDNCGLLRSMVVEKQHRSEGIAARLVRELEQYAASLGIDCMYLLTETAPDYFEKKGYERIRREEVPPIVQTSSEFSHVCPVSAIVMKKPIEITK